MSSKFLVFFTLIAFLVLIFIKSPDLRASGITRFDIIPLPTSSSGSTSLTSPLDFDIVFNPLFPSIVEFPPFGDILSKRPGYGIIGSNPTYEIKLNIKSNEIDIRTVDLVDSIGATFKAIPFTTSKVKGTSDRLLITITIPNTVAIGSCEFFLNPSDSSVLKGEIEIANFLKTKIKKTKQIIGKPSINRISIKRDDNIFIATIRGKNFAPKNIIYSNGLIENESSDPENTRASIFPGSLNAEISDIKFEDSENLKLKFLFPEELSEATDIVIVITTPRGTTSKGITINKNLIFF